ncbi:TRAP transporter small permease [Brevibacterium sp. CBA3109]|uniref:TRAP transporter small permease n=1 Tax=Brevibacterium koreense TaxID=3140787 RepID=A0AAU7UH51_9MICO
MLKFTEVLGKCLTITTAAAIIVMMVHIVTHALMRSLFDAPIYGTNEIVEYWYLPIVALLGIPAAQLQKKHITVTLAIERARPATASVFRVFACILGALVSIAFAWFGLMKALENMAIGSTADVSDVITWPVYFLVPIVFVLLAALYVLDALVIARTGQTETDLATGEPPEHDIEYRADRSSANGHNL